MVLLNKVTALALLILADMKHIICGTEVVRVLWRRFRVVERVFSIFLGILDKLDEFTVTFGIRAS